MRKTIRLLSAALGISLALAACGRSSETPAAGTTEDSPGEQALPTATAAPEPTATQDTGYDTFARWSGDWEGTWENTTFGSTGDIKARVTFSPDGSAAFTFDVGGFVFGALDPPEVSFTGSFDASGITIDLPGDAVFGDVRVTINPDGEFDMVGDIIPTAGIARVEASGTFAETTVEGTYTVFFDDERVAEGNVSMTKLP